jgi:hypothetical protein
MIKAHDIQIYACEKLSAGKSLPYYLTAKKFNFYQLTSSYRFVFLYNSFVFFRDAKVKEVFLCICIFNGMWLKPMDEVCVLSLQFTTNIFQK